MSEYRYFFLVSCEAVPDEVLPENPEAIFQSDGTKNGDFDQALYELAILIEKDLRDPIVTNIMVEKFEHFHEVKLTNILSSPIYKGTASSVDIEEIESDLVYDSIQYYGAIMIPNFDVANFTLEPIIVPGVEVEYNFDDLVGDVALGWYYNESNEKEYIYLDENLATSIERPVYIITNDDSDDAEKEKKIDSALEKTAKSTLGSPYPAFVMVKVYTAFGESKADYNLRELLVYTNGSSQVGSRRNIGNFEPNISNFISPHPMLGYSISNVLRGYGITYERDWLKSYKNVTWPDGRSCGSCCRMKNSGDWYNKFWVDYDNGVLEELHPSYENTVVIHDNGLFNVEWVY